MPLAEFSSPLAVITGGGTTFEVGALSLSDLAELRRQHVIALLEAFDAYKELLLQPGETQRAYGAISIFLEMAEAVAQAICLAAREPDRLAEARRLPIGTQIQALTAIAQLSLADATLPSLPDTLKNIASSLGALRPEEIN